MTFYKLVRYDSGGDPFIYYDVYHHSNILRLANISLSQLIYETANNWQGSTHLYEDLLTQYNKAISLNNYIQTI